MRRHNWSRSGSLDLDVTGIIQARRYVDGGCSGEIKILVLDPTGDTAGVIKMTWFGKMSSYFLSRWSDFQNSTEYEPFRQELGCLLQSLQLPLLHTSLYLAVAAPAECPIETKAPAELEKSQPLMVRVLKRHLRQAS